MVCMMHLTEIQRDALPIVAQYPSAPGIAPVTLDALVAKGLIERSEHDGHRSNYRLTGRGYMLCGEITERPADGPAVADDPFATFDQYNEGV